MDLVEVAPVYDPTGMTSILAAQLLLNSIGFIFHERAKVRAADSVATPA
jgi:agmatinase